MKRLTYQELIFRFIKLILGFFIIAIGIVLMKNAELGLNPWGTFHLGVHLKTGISFGRVSQLTGLTVIIISIFLKIYPSVATILNMLLIGAFVDLLDLLAFIPKSNQLPFQLLMLIIGTLLFSFGIYYYLMAGLGGGPRDGLMIGLVKSTHLPVKYIKSAIELFVIAIGFLLGGTVGIGTILTVFLGSFFLDWLFTIHHINPKAIPQINFRTLTLEQ